VVMPRKEKLTEDRELAGTAHIQSGIDGGR
jgi:hypothetical protein